MTSDAAPSVDGRRARRERSRAAVIDAVFALVADGKVPPSVEQVSERSGVSVSSIFRMFDGLDDMRSQAFEEFHVRYAHLLTADLANTADLGATADLDQRIDRLVRARVELYSAAGPLMNLARQRALDHEPMADRVGAQRLVLAEQTQQCFRNETGALTPAEAANLVALVDVTTSPEAFHVLGAAHGRSRRQIERTWRRAVTVIIAEWCNQPDGTNSPNQEAPA